MLESTKKQHRAADVRAAALPLLALGDIHYGALPTEITSLPIFALSRENIDSWHITTNALIFTTGSGFGHWGIVVCRAGSEREATNSLHAVVIPWDDGVFFWKEL